MYLINEAQIQIYGREWFSCLDREGFKMYEIYTKGSENIHLKESYILHLGGNISDT